MENRGLLFIPDISGFTRFVTGMEIQHSRQIIQRLLEVLIDANQLDLEISEVEGDAILFYRFGERPDMTEVYAQIERMFCDFHRQLRTYDQRRLCQCQPCRTAVELSLKVITHYGEFTGYNVKHFSKLIGKDVIVAHQLLKNDIAEHEYWLVTDELQPGKPQTLRTWMQWDASVKRTETGEIPFHYTQLGSLKNGIGPDPLPLLEPAEKELVISVSRDYDVPHKMLFYTAGHLEFRHRWQEGVQAVEEIDHFLPGLGSRCRVTRTDGSSEVLVASSFTFEEDRDIDYSETNESLTRTTRYTFAQLPNDRGRLTIDVLLRNDPALVAEFRSTEQAPLEGALQRSLVNLEGLLKVVEPPVDF
ncbi:MAG TPA: DUF2652 domain-containing protein [Flavobacteriales bacterium]|jgi:hypothetical protein|nr:DUF2652 domain-containing protein [Flavobacteriales bacterium]